jgi:RNA polymerase sigma factor (sigma-70 family)
MGSDRIQLLLEDLGWLRTLARRLARDPDVADDLVQDACAAALRQQQPPNSWRAWLTTVVQNLMAARRRDDRRRPRLQSLSEADAVCQGQGSVQRAADQQRLAAAVMELDEPYRSTVLLRFFDGFPPRRIAREQGVPVATVHSRLQRAMQQLRRRLDRDYGDRANWLAALVAVGWPGSATTTRRAASSVVVAGSAVVLLVLGMLWWPTNSGPALHTVATSAANSTTDLPTAADLPVVATRVEPTTGTRGTGALPTPLRRSVRGRVIDCEGLPVGGVPISGAPGESPPTLRIEQQFRGFATSDGTGVFVGELACEQAFLLADRSDLATVWISNWSSQSAVEPIVVVAPQLQVAGEVVTWAGERVTEGRVWLELPNDLHTRVGDRLDRACDAVWSVPLDEQGQFVFPGLPAVRGATLRFSTPRGDGVAVAPMLGTDRLRLELPASAPARGPHGTVLLANGAPAAGARVCMGSNAAYADSAGHFAFPSATPTGHLVAALPRIGWGERYQDEVDAGVAGTVPLVVSLTSPPGVASGRVVDDAGQPVPGAEVWLVGPAPFGMVDHVAVHLEYFLAGGPARVGVLANEGHPGEKLVHIDHATSLWFFVVSDAAGRFELTGLLDRSYQLAAFDRSTGCFGTTLDVRDGSTTDLVIRRNEVLAEVAGRLIAADGEPIVGAQVRQKIVPFHCARESPLGQFEWYVLRNGGLAQSDADGFFRLRQVGSRGTFLMVEGDSVMPTVIDPGVLLRDPAEPVLVRRRCPVEVVLADPAEADSCCCEDQNGNLVPLLMPHANSTQFSMALPLHGGRSGLFCVGEDAVRLRLSRGAAPVRRIPLALRSDQRLLVQ